MDLGDDRLELQGLEIQVESCTYSFCSTDSTQNCNRQDRSSGSRGSRQMMGKGKWRNDESITSKVWRRLRRISTLSCSFCRPHRGENQTYRKRSVKKPRKHRQGNQSNG